LDPFVWIAAAGLADFLLNLDLFATPTEPGFIAGFTKGALAAILADGARRHHRIDTVGSLKTV